MFVLHESNVLFLQRTSASMNSVRQSSAPDAAGTISTRARDVGGPSLRAIAVRYCGPCVGLGCTKLADGRMRTYGTRRRAGRQAVAIFLHWNFPLCLQKRAFLLACFLTCGPVCIIHIALRSPHRIAVKSFSMLSPGFRPEI